VQPARVVPTLMYSKTECRSPVIVGQARESMTVLNNTTITAVSPAEAAGVHNI
jgi:hypothetical protein